MTRKTDSRRDDPEQSKRFAQAARELGPDETGDAFERAFKKVSERKKPDQASGTGGKKR